MNIDVNAASVLEAYNQKGYIKFPISGDTKKVILNALTAWGHFCLQDLDVKSRHVFGENGGYEFKDPRVHKNAFDHKENFHVSTLYKGFDSSSEDFHFLGYAQALLRHIQPIVGNIATLLSNACGIDFSAQVSDITRYQLRFLNYFAGQDIVEIAKPHVDKGFITIHLIETTDALQIMWDHEWRPVIGDTDTIFAYPSLAGQYLSDGILSGIAHQAIMTKEVFEFGRKAIVLFIDPVGFYYNKAEFGGTQKVFFDDSFYGKRRDVMKKYFVFSSVKDMASL